MYFRILQILLTAAFVIYYYEIYSHSFTQMSTISVRDNENNRWERNKEKKQLQKRTRGTKAIVKVWELNAFALRLS